MTKSIDGILPLTLSDIPVKEEVFIGRTRYKGMRIPQNTVVNLDGRELAGLGGAVIVGDGNRAIVVLDNMAKSISVGDIVKLRKNMYVVQDIIPANTPVSKRYAMHTFSMKIEKRQTYLVARDGQWLRVPASEISGIVGREGA